MAMWWSYLLGRTDGRVMQRMMWGSRKHPRVTMQEHIITIGASLPIVLESTMITYHCQVVSLGARKLAGSFHPVVMAPITVGSNHHPAMIYHCQFKLQARVIYSYGISTGSCYDMTVIYPCRVDPLLGSDIFIWMLVFVLTCQYFLRLLDPPIYQLIDSPPLIQPTTIASGYKTCVRMPPRTKEIA